MEEMPTMQPGRQLLKSRSSGSSRSFSGTPSSGSTFSGGTSGTTMRSSSSRTSSTYVALAFYSSSRRNRYRSRASGESDTSDCTYDSVEDTKELILDTAPLDPQLIDPQSRAAMEEVRKDREAASPECVATTELMVTSDFELMRDVSCGQDGKPTWYGYNVEKGNLNDYTPESVYNPDMDDPDFLENDLTCNATLRRSEICERAVADQSYDLTMDTCIQDMNTVGMCTDFYSSASPSTLQSTPLTLLMVVFAHWVGLLLSRG